MPGYVKPVKGFITGKTYTNPKKLGKGFLVKKFQDFAFRNKEEKFDNEISSFGYISTSIDKNQALSFTFGGEKMKRVLYKIDWKYPECHYFLDGGSFAHEKEVLLMDGMTFEVEDVSQDKDARCF